jgi:hypothetical protein
MEVFSVLDGGDLESIRDAAEPVIERTNLEKLSVASFTALGTPEMFNPVGDNHAELSPTVIIVRDYPATNGGLSEQFWTLPDLNLPATGLIGISLLVLLAQELPGLSVEKVHPRAGLAGNSLVRVFGRVLIIIQPMLDFHRCHRTGEQELGHCLHTTDPRRLTMI